MYQRIIDAIGLLLLGKEYIGGIVQEGDKEKPVYVLDSIFPNQEIKVLAHKAIEEIVSDKTDSVKIIPGEA